MYAREQFSLRGTHGQAPNRGSTTHIMQSSARAPLATTSNNNVIPQTNKQTTFVTNSNSSFPGKHNGQLQGRNFTRSSGIAGLERLQQLSHENQTTFVKDSNSSFFGTPNGQLQSRNFTRSSGVAGLERLQQLSHENGNPPSSSNLQFRQQGRSQAMTNNMNFPSTSRMDGYRSNSTSANNNLGLMGMPKLNRYLNSESSTAGSSKAMNVSQNADSRLNMRKSGETEKEKLCILTGTAERIIKYGKIFQNHFCYFQVFGSVVSLADGKVQFEKTMILRDKKGPILQLTYYSNATHINIDDFHLGQNLRAVGRMVGPNIMSAITIRAATDEELDLLPRLCYISDNAVSILCGDGKIQL